MHTKIQIQVHRLIKMQATFVLIIAACWFLTNISSGVAALLGGVAGVLPTIYFAHRFFSRIDERDNKKILKTFFRAEFLKLVASCALIVVFVMVFKSPLLPLISGFLGAHMAYMFYLVRVKN